MNYSETLALREKFAAAAVPALVERALAGALGPDGDFEPGVLGRCVEGYHGRSGDSMTLKEAVATAAYEVADELLWERQSWEDDPDAENGDFEPTLAAPEPSQGEGNR